MKHNLDQQFEGPRFERRLKKKKYNLILNILIAIVVLLIIYFGSQLFFSNEDNANATIDKEQTYSDDIKIGHEKAKHDPKVENESQAAEEDVLDHDNDTNSEEVIVKDGGTSPNVINTIINPSWQPVGTVQSEPHVSVYKEGSVDWNEMMKAVSYATGLAESSYTVWWVGRNGDNQSTITIENNNDYKLYRVYIQWMENEGWKPLKIEELKENDTPAYKGSH